MCYYTLRTCAYPHRDTLSSLIFDPHKNKHWIECDQPKPWGRISCGHLIVEHPRSMKTPVVSYEHHSVLSNLSNTHEADQDTMAITPVKGSSGLLVVTPSSDCDANVHNDRHLFQQCEWCTNVLKVLATKARYLQTEAEEKIGVLHQFIDDIPEIKTLYHEIAQKEKELDKMRHEAWKAVSTALASNLQIKALSNEQSSVSPTGEKKRALRCD